MSHHEHPQATNTENDTQLEPLIAACEKEPIHIPHAIQGFGATIITNPNMTQVLYASANATAFYAQHQDPKAPASAKITQQSDWLRINPQEFFPKSLWQELSNAGHNEAVWIETKTLSYLAWKSDDYWIIEAEPNYPHVSNWFEVQFQRAFHLLRSSQTQQQLLQNLCDLVQGIANYNRVMIFQFDDDWHGKVITEALREPFSSLLHHHFPASDIPPQARAMYSKNPIRLIPDCEQPSIPLTAIHGTAAQAEANPIDLSTGVLRAVSPLHSQYLENLGVGASTSIAIFKDEALWGLVACHHSEPQVLDRRRRRLLVRIVEFAAERLWLIHARNIERYVIRMQEAREQLAISAKTAETPHELVKEHAERWLDLFQCHGICYVRGDKMTTMGQNPSSRELQKIVRWLEEHARDEFAWHSHNLKDELPELLKSNSLFAGLLAIPLKNNADVFSYFLLFRLEQAEVRSWAGVPEKLQVETATGIMLGPRKSFALWEEEVRGKSRQWRPAQLYAARDVARDLLIVADTMQLNILNDKLESMNQQLEELASFDALTGIWNRRRLEEKLASELKEAQRYKKRFGILLFDIDHFKRVNDEHGHNVGDQILQALSVVVKEVLRDTDMFGRWGGEEFLVIAPATGMPELMQVAERVRKAVADLNQAELPQVTISIGVAEYINDQRWDELIERADRAMYEAKDSGRNRVVAGTAKK